MLNIQKLVKQNQSKIEWLFLVWLMSIPIGNKIMSFSIGFMTVYPNLILSILLFPIAIRSVWKWGTLLKTFLFILVGVVLFSIFWGVFNESNESWMIDFRIVLLNFIFTTIFFGIFTLLGKEVFLRILQKGIVFFLGILLGSGIFEYYTGIHLSGSFTDALAKIGVATKIAYSPLYVYGNANTYLVYLSLISFLLLGILKLRSVKVNNWFFISLFLLIFMFSEAADSKISLIVILLSLAFFLFSILKKVIFQNKNIIIFSLIGIAFISIVFINSPLYMGHKYSLQVAKSTTIVNEYGVEEELEEGDVNDDGLIYDENYGRFLKKLSSTTVRKNLIYNGFDIIKSHPILGIGPGQFRVLHKDGRVKHNTESVVNPHNYIIELIAQYGVFGWLYFSFLGVLFFIQIKICAKTKENYWILSLIPVFLFYSLSPSSFLVLDINWIFISLTVVFTHILYKMENNNV